MQLSNCQNCDVIESAMKNNNNGIMSLTDELESSKEEYKQQFSEDYYNSFLKNLGLPIHSLLDSKSDEEMLLGQR